MLHQQDPALVRVPSNSDFFLPQAGQCSVPNAFSPCPPRCIPHLTRLCCLTDAGTPPPRQGKPVMPLCWNNRLCGENWILWCLNCYQD